MRVRAGMISAIALICACTAIAQVEPRTTEKTTLVLDAGCGLNHSTRQPCASSDVTPGGRLFPSAPKKRGIGSSSHKQQNFAQNSQSQVTS